MIAGLIGAVCAAPAYAQDNDGDEVVVTGTRIKQSNLTSPTPVKVVDVEAIEISGETNAADILRELPALGVSALSTTNSNFTVNSSGLNTINLRNLGASRALVLINGKRVVSGVPGAQIVDFNSIPTEFVERFDVLTGGSSAVYGSDALAGVVNVILKDDYEGASLSYQMGGTTEFGDYESQRITGTFGSNFADDRGNAVFGVTHSRNDGAFFRDRDGQGVDDLSYAFFTGQADDVLTDVSTIIGRPFFSSFSESGRINVIGTNGGTAAQFAGTGDPYSAAQFGFNRQQFRALAVPTERTLFNTNMSYNVSDTVQLTAEASYSITDTSAELEPFPLSSADIYGTDPICGPTGCDTTTGVSITNAFVPDSIRDAARAALPGVADEDIVVGFARRMTEVDRRGATNKRQTARFALGINGAMTDKLNYDVSLTHGRTSQAQQSSGQINTLNMLQALDTAVIGGEVVCADALARSQGCDPINIFGRGTISEDAADYVRAPSSRQGDLEQTVLQGFLTGEVGALQETGSVFSRPIGWVAGMEYRNEISSFVPDALSQSGLNAGNVSPATAGEFSVIEGFGELELPLLTDVPFAERVDLRMAARVSDYTTVGQTFAWSGNLQWQVNDQLTLRGQYAEAVRAPNIGELFQGAAETFGTLGDPCSGLTVTGGVPTVPSGDATVAANCFADPALQARVARDGTFIPTQAELQGIGGFISGNPNLSEEDGTSYTLGFIWNPESSAILEPFAITVDYFNIEIDNAISNIGRATSASRCYTRGEFCDNVRRFTAGPSIGAIEGVDSNAQNVAKLATSGFDVQASYDFDLTDIFKAKKDVGEFTLTGTYQYLDKYETTALPGDTPNDASGDFGLAKHEAQITGLYRKDGFRFAWTTQYIGKSGTNVFGDPDQRFERGAVTFHDINARWQLPFAGDAVSVFGGVDNVFDKFVPTGVGFNATGHYTDPDVYDALGRRYYVGARLDF